MGNLFQGLENEGGLLAPGPRSPQEEHQAIFLKIQKVQACLTRWNQIFLDQLKNLRT